MSYDYMRLKIHLDFFFHFYYAYYQFNLQEDFYLIKIEFSKLAQILVFSVYFFLIATLVYFCQSLKN